MADIDLSKHYVSERTQQLCYAYINRSDMSRSDESDERSESRLASEQRRISFQRLQSLLRDRKVPEDVCLTAGQQTRIQNYGLLGFAMQNAPTLDQALQLAAKYHQTATPLLEIDFVNDEQLFFLVMHNSYGLNSESYQQVVEEIISSFPSVLFDLTGREMFPKHLALSYPQPRFSHSYREFFRCEPEFLSEQTFYAFDIAHLTNPIRGANASTFELLERRCQELLALAPDETSLIFQITRLLMQQPATINKLSDLTGVLHLSERSIRRKLTQEQSSFQKLLDDVRSHLAEDYLTHTNLSAQEIAEFLGYSEASNFRRAFKRWSNTTPERYRQRQGLVDDPASQSTL